MRFQLTNNTIIVISGNIGVGKTTLIKNLCKTYGWVPYLEEVDKSPYLEDFYKDPERYSFETQIFFLSIRLKQYMSILKEKENQVIIVDRCIYEDIYIFAKSLYSSGLMSDRQYKTYVDHAKVIASIFEEKDPINHIFYLRNSNISQILKRIFKRDREYEQNIQYSYIEKLHESYEQWSKTDKRIVIIDITGKDLYKAKDLDYVSNIINKCISSGK